MRIQHNIMAMNAYRNYTNNTSALSKNLEKLSSGYKINRAGDDAAGLAISEKMRAQITSLATAQKNAKDGISLVQTAEGALTEVHDMLNRMVELAQQSANGTYDDGVDRANLQKEFSALRDEINRIADSSNFNGISLLDGSLASSGGTGQVGAEIDGFSGALANTLQTVAGDLDLGEYMLTKEGVAEQKAKFSVDLQNVKYTANSTGDNTMTLTIGNAAVTIAVSAGASGVEIAEKFQAAISTAGGVSINGATYTVTVEGSKLKFEMASAPGVAGVTAGNVSTIDPANFQLDIGMSSDTLGSMENTVNLGSVNVIAKGEVAQAGNKAYTSISMTTEMVADGYQLKIGDETYTFAVGENSTVDTTGTNVVDLTHFSASGGQLDSDGKLQAAGLSEALQKLANTASGNKKFSVGAVGNNITLMQTASDKTVYKTKEELNAQFKLTDGQAPAVDPGVKTPAALKLQIGENSEDYNILKVSVSDMHADALGIGEGVIDIDSQDNAQKAVSVLKNAINLVSSTRGDLGATQNRLEHTINNLSVMQENIQDAESTIRDVDVADEMMAYTKNNILVQSAQAMLAQANQVPQGVLQLLQ